MGRVVEHRWKEGAFGEQRAFPFAREDFLRVRRLIGTLAGIALLDRKENMVYNRLVRRLRATGITGFREYLDWVEQPDSSERTAFVNALTTNLTSFFRESHHFDLLDAHARKHRGREPLRVWSSACSTGEEPYSAAIVLREAGCAAEILATDIDTEVLKKARIGVYALEAIENLDPARARRFFLRGTGPNEGRVKVRPELCAMVKFSQRNLQAQHWPAHEKFDVIFCRNVMIYFDKDAQRRVLDSFVRVLRPGGLLFVGHSESYASGHAALHPCGKTAYERRADESATPPGRSRGQ